MPPLSSGNYNYPSLGSSNPSFTIPVVAPPTISTVSSTDNAYQNEVTGKLPVQDESKLHFDDLSSQGNFLNSPKIPSTQSFPSTQLPSFTQNTGFANIFQNKPPSQYGQIPVQVQAFAVTQTAAADSGKYTGGFGGAPGTLGQQKPGILLSGNKPAAAAAQIQQPALTGRCWFLSNIG